MVTVGADVEVFGKRKDGHFVALCDKIGGTKEKPLQCKDLPKGFMVQEDNVSLEYNIPYAINRADFVKKIGIMRKKCQELLGNLGLDMAEEASVCFTEGELTHPKALIFGCEPDYNAWTKGQNPRPDETEDPTLRTAGGHIHVGTNDVDMVNGICAMDLFLGVPSVLLDSSPESVRRRKRYGKAGAMRPKPYGYEYRVLSNFWMFSDKLVGWVFDNTILSTKFDVRRITKGVSQQIQQCIDNGDMELASSLVKLFNIPMPKEVVEEKKEDSSLPFTIDEALHHTMQPITNWNAMRFDTIGTATIARGPIPTMQRYVREEEDEI